VATLNSAVRAYLADGGDLSGKGLGGIVAELRKGAAGEVKNQIAGYRGSYVDQRLEAHVLSPAEAQKSGPRAVWDPSNHRFVVAQSGIGISKLTLTGSYDAETMVDENRQSTMKLASADHGWIWDFDDPVVINARKSPDQQMVYDIPGQVAPPDPDAPERLSPPLFSVYGGDYYFEEFGSMTLALSNPGANPTETVYMVSINGAGYIEYTGGIDVLPDSHIAAYALVPGSGDFYQSSVASEVYSMKEQDFAGSASGSFHTPEGPSGMVTHTITDDNHTYFEWGSPAGGFQTGSFLNFEGADFSEVKANEYFKMGTLDFYNSTIWMSTIANKVSLDVNVDFTTPDISEVFTFDFELINTTNHSSQTANQNADYVRMSMADDNVFETSLDGDEYYLQVQFGYAGSEGFANVDEFHVHEGASATADIFGFFTRIEDDESDDD
ncbi:MAG: choice-of-anchor K domain-containing protein, partial [Verrucomicrobiota bacterium]